ncbi:MAG: hypothetical protein CMB79_05815, partial [Filomicrobium sp.]|nr:hypothetical protein [Filomicrobium sp.]
MGDIFQKGDENEANYLAWNCEKVLITPRMDRDEIVHQLIEELAQQPAKQHQCVARTAQPADFRSLD